MQQPEVIVPDSIRNSTLAVLMSLLLAWPGLAGGPDTWVPARWQGGPLELQRRARDKTLPADRELQSTLRQWYDPSTLSLLQGTPINCLLVTWSVGGDSQTERQQHELIKSYAREAHSLGMAVLGLVYPGSVPSSFVKPAVDASLDGLVAEGKFPGGQQFVSEVRRALQDQRSKAVVFPLAAREDLSLAPEIPVFAAADASGPGLRELTEGTDATPSSEPWIDSNIWLVRSISSWGSSRPIWLGEGISPSAVPEDYFRAIADAAAAGGHWVLALSDDLRQGLRLKRADATATWHRIAVYLKFQQEHADWYKYPPFAVCGFIQDSSGKERNVSGENLNLAIRQRIPLRVIERAQLSAASLEGLQAVQGIDLIQPTAQERGVLSAFIEKGGLAVVGPSWKQVEIPKNQGFAIVPEGKGRVVVYRDEWPEPGSLAKDLVDLLGRDNLGVRLFRVASVLSHVSSHTSGSPLLVHLLNYASYPSESVLVRVAGDFTKAHFYDPEGDASSDIAIEKSDGRIEVTIPKLSVYGVLSVEK